MALMAKEGLPVASIPGVLTILAFAFVGVYAGIAGIFVTLCVALFFRDPERSGNPQKGEILCPADGRVVAVADGPAPRGMQGNALRISIFMSVLNVHVNRVPMDGQVLDVRHIPGGFAMAQLDEARINNERTEILIEDPSGRHFFLVQVAGMIARRIICRLKEGDRIRAGERFGLICFGSRLDLYFPPGFESLVGIGDRVRAGETVLAGEK